MCFNKRPYVATHGCMSKHTLTPGSSFLFSRVSPHGYALQPTRRRCNPGGVHPSTPVYIATWGVYPLLPRGGVPIAPLIAPDTLGHWGPSRRAIGPGWGNNCYEYKPAGATPSLPPFFFNPMLLRPTPQSLFDLIVRGSTSHKVHG